MNHQGQEAEQMSTDMTPDAALGETKLAAQVQALRAQIRRLRGWVSAVLAFCVINVASISVTTTLYSSSVEQAENVIWDVSGTVDAARVAQFSFVKQFQLWLVIWTQVDLQSQADILKDFNAQTAVVSAQLDQAVAVVTQKSRAISDLLSHEEVIEIAREAGVLRSLGPLYQKLAQDMQQITAAALAKPSGHLLQELQDTIAEVYRDGVKFDSALHETVLRMVKIEEEIRATIRMNLIGYGRFLLGINLCVVLLSALVAGLALRVTGGSRSERGA